MKRLLFIGLVLALVFITRFWQLESVPVHLTQDEISVGYGAYSLVKTGADEWGHPWPLQFRSVGDYKQPVLFYLTAVSVALFGLTELAVRLPVAIFSTLSLILVYFWFRDWLMPKYRSWAKVLVLLWGLSPWHIILSRTGLEAVVAVFFLLLNLYAWNRFILKPAGRWVLLGVGAAILAIASYHSTKVFIPLFNLALLWLYRRQFIPFVTGKLKRSQRFVILTGLVALAVWLYQTFYSGSSMVRGQMTLLRNDFDYARALLPRIEGIGLESIAKIWLLVAFWYKRLLEYLDPSFWLFDGPGLTLPGFPGQGVIYAVEFGLLLLGLSVLLRPAVLHRFIRAQFKPEWVLPLFLFLGVLPATLANNSKHVLRALNALPPIYVLILLGLIVFWGWFRRRKLTLVAVAILALGYLLGVSRFADYYLVHLPVQLSELRQYPWTAAAKEAIRLAPGYNEVVVDSRFGTQGPYAIGVPHYYFLFYSRYDPSSYQHRPGRETETVNFANYNFRYINWQVEKHQGKLYVGSPWSFPVEKIPPERVLWRQPFRNGVSGLMIVDGNFPDPGTD